MEKLSYLVQNEFEQRVFIESYERIYKCLTMIDENDLWRVPGPNIPAIGNQILHISGNARQWILSGIGGKTDNRVREEEFLPQLGIKKAELIFLLENLRMSLRTVLEDLTDSTLERKYNIQGFEVSGFSAIIHVLEHFSYHTGQITLLTKLLTEKDTGYYKNMNLNKRNSVKKP